MARKVLPSWFSALDRFSQARILVVGDIMHDVFIWGQVKRISPEAPVPVVEVTRETALLGGAANVVHNVCALGAKASLAGVIGQDAAGDAVKKALAEIGADDSGLLRSRARPTVVKTRIIAHHQQVVRFDREEVRPLRPATFKSLVGVLQKLLPRADAVIVSDYAKGLVSEALMTLLINACRKQKKILAVDPKPGHQVWYRGATIITPNQQEAAEMAGRKIESETDLLLVGQTLLERLELSALLVTRGEKGMSLFRPGHPPLHVPAKAREVYDVTGAGDTVIATLTVALVAGLALPEAIQVANLAAGIVVGKLGTATATVEELKATINHRRQK